MSDIGHKTALDLAVAAARAAEAAAPEAQGELFAEPDRAPEIPGLVAPGQPGQAVATRGPGRPPGARNRRTDELAAFYAGRYGDPLERGVAIAAMPILAPGVVEGLAQRLGCTRFEAFKEWNRTLGAILPYIHQRLATLEVRPAGAPGGPPLDFGYAVELAGELVGLIDEQGGEEGDEGG